MNAEKAFKRFFKGQSRFPKFKKKKNQDVKMYFVKTDKNTAINVPIVIILPAYKLAAAAEKPH